MKNIKIVLLALWGVFIVSCESNTYNEISVQTTNPTYVANIKPIISANCVSCHFGTNQFPNLESYEGVKNACINNDLVCRIDTPACGEIMPQGGRMPQPNIDLVKLWVANGFINE